MADNSAMASDEEIRRLNEEIMQKDAEMIQNKLEVIQGMNDMIMSGEVSVRDGKLALPDPNKPDPYKLDMISAYDLARAELPPIYYAVEGLVPEGLTVLAAQPKSGKSWMMLDMCLQVARGEPFLGFKTRQSDVCYLALEDGDKFEQERLRKYVQEINEVPKNFHFVFKGVRSLDHGFLDQLDVIRKSLPNLKLIVIDTLKFVKCSTKKGESSYDSEYRTGSMLKEWTDNNGLAVVVVTHARQAVNPNDALSNINGTNGLTGSVDAAIVIAKEKRTDTHAVLSADGRRIRQSEHDIVIDWDTCRWRYVGVVDPEENERRKREKELEDLRQSDIYKAVITLADHNIEGWYGGARKLIDDACEYGIFITESAMKVGGILANNLPVFAQDGVRVQKISNGSGANSYRISTWTKVK